MSLQYASVRSMGFNGGFLPVFDDCLLWAQRILKNWIVSMLSVLWH